MGTRQIDKKEGNELQLKRACRSAAKDAVDSTSGRQCETRAKELRSRVYAQKMLYDIGI